MRKAGTRVVGGNAATPNKPAWPAKKPEPAAATETKSEPASTAGSFVSTLKGKE